MILTDAFAAALLSGAITSAVPLLLAGLGEQVSETSGVLNIGIEGMMLLGAYAGFSVAYASHAMWLGFVAGAGAGAVVAAVMAVACVWAALDQIVVGIALTLGVQGLTSLLHAVEFSRIYPRLPAAAHWSLPVLSGLPVLGPGLFDQHPLAYAAALLPVVLGVMYRHSFLGLNLRAAGDAPAAVDAAGIGVRTTRTAAVLTTGVLAGLGGAYLSEVGSGLFVPLMTNGAGFIGIVLAMLARGRPWRVLWGALLFGACLSLTTAFQVAGLAVPVDIVQMLPFAAVMLALVLFGRHAGLPAALGVPYRRDQS
jgi:simple sugar transport system permease protein